MNKKIVLGLLLAASTQLAVAEGNGSIAPKLSTLGLGLEYKYPVTDQFSVGVGAYGGSYSRTEETDKVEYDADLKLRHLTVLGNYYPWDNGFHFAGGLVLNGTKLEADAQATGAMADKKFEFNGNTYTVSQIGGAHAKADFRRVAPYLGIGWDNGNKGAEGWSVAASAGLMFSGSPDVQLTYDKCDSSLGIDCNQLDKDIAKERAEFEDDLDSFKVWPVVSIGAMYRF